MESRISGVILAGGDNKRFGGRTKSKIVIDGESIISRNIDTIKDLFSEIIIVTNTPEEFRDFIQYKIVGDRYFNTGPIGGIHAAMKSSSGEAIFVFAGDMPFLNKEIILNQINEFDPAKHDILIPKIGRYIEPLHAIYSTSVLDKLEDFINDRESRSVRDFLAEMNVVYLRMKESVESKRAFTNINSPSDIADIM